MKIRCNFAILSSCTLILICDLIYEMKKSSRVCKGSTSLERNIGENKRTALHLLFSNFGIIFFNSN